MTLVMNATPLAMHAGAPVHRTVDRGLIVRTCRGARLAQAGSLSRRDEPDGQRRVERPSPSPFAGAGTLDIEASASTLDDTPAAFGILS
jgi:hypothetical protein